MDSIGKFKSFVNSNVEAIGRDVDFTNQSNLWLQSAIRHNYALNFSWLGRPIIQKPQDIYAIQELIWSCRPDLIIETGIAHGGSLIMSASMLALIDYCDSIGSGVSKDVRSTNSKVVGIDIDIREHNRKAICDHPLALKIEMIEGSSVSERVISLVQNMASVSTRVMGFLDSNHTHDHVLAELEAYAPLVTPGSYCVVWDTGIEDLPAGFCDERPWGKGNNPKTAVRKYLNGLETQGRVDSAGRPIKMEIDKFIEHKIAITAAPDGFLRRV